MVYFQKQLIFNKVDTLDNKYFLTLESFQDILNIHLQIRIIQKDNNEEIGEQ